MIQNNKFQNTRTSNLDEISMLLKNGLNLPVEQIINQDNEVIFCENCKGHQIFSEQHLQLYFQIHQKKEILRQKNLDLLVAVTHLMILYVCAYNVQII